MDMKTFFGMIIRHGIGVAGGAVGASGMVTGGEVEILAGALATLVSVGWSAVRKLRRARRARQSHKASGR